VRPNVWGDGEQLALADGNESLQRALVHLFCDLWGCFLLARAGEWRWSWLKKNCGWISVHELHAFLERACSWFGEDGGRLRVVVDGVMGGALLC
jgi:hypothetical protein